MSFNSIDFAVFLPIVFLVYWALQNKTLLIQNSWLLLTSWIFYTWWDWRFLSLIVLSSVTDYSLGMLISKYKQKTQQKLFLIASLFINLGILGFFKYFDFFVDSLKDAFTLFGGDFEPRYLNVILPVGISFYTFQTLSYTIDVYRGKIEPTKDFVAFSAYVSFFPQLVAGPIERASNLLPQFHRERRFSNVEASEGLRQILWGLFKKGSNCR